jgi:hypothetical protein
MNGAILEFYIKCLWWRGKKNRFFHIFKKIFNIFNIYSKGMNIIAFKLRMDASPRKEIF